MRANLSRPLDEDFLPEIQAGDIKRALEVTLLARSRSAQLRHRLALKKLGEPSRRRCT